MVPQLIRHAGETSVMVEFEIPEETAHITISYETKIALLGPFPKEIQIKSRSQHKTGKETCYLVLKYGCLRFGVSMWECFVVVVFLLLSDNPVELSRQETFEACVALPASTLPLFSF